MVLQYPLNQRDAVFQHCGRYQRSSSKSSTVSEHFPISICFRNRLEVKSTRLDVHEQILNSYVRALCSKCNIQSSGGGVCLIFFFAVLRRLDLPPSDFPLLWQPCSHLFPFSWPYYSPLMFLLLEMRIRKQEKHLFELQSWRKQINSLLSIG